ncbi:MAG: hypothetical protein K9L24_01585 [Spirochaetia bacterium]|nr:hypothetical protein [Spirochaetia bacterium]MCF7946711.1 hypothetical protein [Spirochaetia bacterium]
MIPCRSSLISKLPPFIFAVTVVFFSVLMISCEEESPLVLPTIHPSITETVIVFPEAEMAGDSSSYDLLYFLAYKKKEIRKLYVIQIPWKRLPAEFKADDIYPDAGDSDFKSLLNSFFGSQIDYVYVDKEAAADKLLTISRKLSENNSEKSSEYEGPLKAESGNYSSNVWEVLIPQSKYYARKEVFENMKQIFNGDVSSRAVRRSFEFLSELGKAPLMIPLEYDKEGIVLYNGSLLKMKIEYLKELLQNK